MLLAYTENGRTTGQLRFRDAGWLRRMKARPSVVSIMPAFTAERQTVADFITGIYKQAYNAHIGVHYPVLMSVRDEHGILLSALGFRIATQETLFLEQYLAQPVDKILRTPRHDIVEVGNLASAGGGASLFLFAALAAYLNHQQRQYAVITGTAFIEKRLYELGLRPQRLAPADPAKLLRQDEDWGRYYDTTPHVLAEHIDDGYKKLQRALGAEYTENRPRLFPRLHYRENFS